MLGNMMGDMEAQQQKMTEKLSAISVEGEAGDGVVKVTATAAREITAIRFDKEKLDWSDMEQVEDMLIIAINDAIEKASEIEAQESQKMIQDMLPGLGGLFGG